jgi:hypothetical protein
LDLDAGKREGEKHSREDAATSVISGTFCYSGKVHFAAFYSCSCSRHLLKWASMLTMYQLHLLLSWFMEMPPQTMSLRPMLSFFMAVAAQLIRFVKIPWCLYLSLDQLSKLLCA